MRRFTGILFALWAMSGAALAQDRPVVVELFTSQGCASCPPADELMGALARRDNVIPLALHVDYWDYIGWKDIFAQPEFTSRQKAYARAAQKSSIYTPQMVVGGTEHVVGFSPMTLLDLIESQKGFDSPVRMHLQRGPGEVIVTARSSRPLKEDALLQIVRYTPEQTVKITRGENAGRTIRYTNIVTAWDAVARWSGAEPLVLRVGIEGEDPVVAIIQRPGPGQILAAAQLR
ncbi:hypothetical protein C8N32_10830 [Rhodovulum imhoffii]|uniref:Secreted protein n=1 Tax=Rhodovulum imhoffii TaxID=365340 RepID=A0A2T5BS56_9RHOB|nr:DUF1223 domain-containing protein [Rhodovulum imhoffii]MBK5932778.1 DUF1223 domain-containing protein [Rhodovulum imhoffii]PTN02081.1 hypothetical protein C8N32_10830 [Rhodovulum imhoffii]